MSREYRVAAFTFFAIYLLTACGQDTPLTPDDPSFTIWSPSRVTTPIVYPTLAPNETPIAVQSNQRADLPLPDCVPKATVPVELPRNFPADLPLPKGLRLYKSLNLNNNPNAVQIIGYTPYSIDGSLRFLMDEFPRAGYPLGRGDSEQYEAESQFSGHGWVGAFWVRDVFICHGVTEWVVIVVKR